MSQKISIGFYSDTFNLGGSEIYLRDVLENLDCERYNIKVFCRRGHPLHSWILRKPQIKIVYLPELSSPIPYRPYETQKITQNASNFVGPANSENLLKTVWRKIIPHSIKLMTGTITAICRVKNIFHQDPVDMIHFNDTGCEPSVIAAFWAGIPLRIGTYHVLPSYDKEKLTWVYRLIEFLSTRCLNMGIAVSQATKEAWTDRTGLPENKIQVIYNGIDLNQFAQLPDGQRLRTELDVAPDAPVVVVPARLHPMKGHKYLIEAAVKVKAEIPNVRFLLAGEGDLLASLQDQVDSLGLRETVKFLGHRDDLKDVFAVADVVALTSVSLETLSYAVIEAMACAKPVVASNFSGLKEVLEDSVTGILVPRYDITAIAEAIVRLLKDKDLAKNMGKEGYHRVKRLFDQKRMLSETFQLYERCMKGFYKEFRVLIVSAKLEHTKRGVETWARETAYALHEKGIDVTLYKGSGPRHRDFEKAIPSIKQHSVLSDRLIKILPKFLWRVGWGFGEQIEETTFALSIILKNFKEKFDIIHMQDAHVAEALQFAHRMGILPAKVILGHGTEEPFWFLKKLPYIQHLAPFHQQEAVAHCGYEKKPTGWYAIPNFVDTEIYKPRQDFTLRRELNIPDDAFVVLSVAAIKSIHKRVDYLIEEFSEFIREGNKNAYLVVAGGRTAQTDDIINKGQELLKDKIRFLINQGPDRMPRIHNMADIFVLCSLKEMMPIALLEALSSGLPCLGNTYPVIEWMIGPGGDCVNMDQKGMLANKLAEYYANGDLRRDQSLKARDHAVKNFSKGVVIDQIIGMYTDVLK